MKKLIGILVLGLMVTLSACGGGLGGSVDVSGVWDGTMTLEGATVPLSFALDDGGSFVSGSFSQSYASGSFSLNSNVSGSRITITATSTTSAGGYTITTNFELRGTVSGDTMTGTLTYSVNGAGTNITVNGSFSLTRS